MLTDGIKSSLIGPKNNTIQVKLKKCFNDPWPDEFGGRSKWDINLFQPWEEDSSSHGKLKDHIDAQFDCTDLLLSKNCMQKTDSPIYALNEVRVMIRAIFYGHHRNSFNHFTIHDPRNPIEPTLHLKIHPPVRYSPHGAPLLLVTCFDHQLAKRLERGESDFQQLVVQGVSREVCPISTSTDEELDLFRYLLRVNSTRMRRSAWQSKNIPRGEDGNPWMSTFVSPLYSEVIKNSCPAGRTNVSYPLNTLCCALCHVRKITLKICTRCRSVYYCSVSCQKAHWAVHRSHCRI